MKIISISILFLLYCTNSFAQVADEAAENILNLYFQTLNQEKLLQTSTYVTKGKIVRGNTEVPFTSYNKKPMYYRIEFESNGKKFITAFNGKSGWTINPLLGTSEPQLMSDEEIERSKLQADYEGMFYNYKEKGYTVEFIDKQNVGFIETYVLQLTTPDEDQILAYIDTQDNVLLKTSSYVMVDNDQEEYELYYKNHRFVNEILFPFTVETKVDNKTEMKMVVDEITFDVEISDSMFEMPGNSSEE
jgi:outer membrane lipoprotein-sorting protein